MKKIFVALLILSVMGGAFAQEWSFSGSADIGEVIDFTVDPIEGEGNTTTGDGIKGKIGANYTNGGLEVGLEFDFYGDDINLTAAYDGGNYFVKIGGSISNIILGGLLSAIPGAPAPLAAMTDLWGYYKFMDGKIHLEAALNGQDAGRYITSSFAQDKFISGFANLDGISGLWLDFALIDGLNFGFMNTGLLDPAKSDFGDRLKETVIGLTFGMVDNLEVSAQFKIEPASLSITGAYGLGDLTIGFGFATPAFDPFAGTAAVGVEYSGIVDAAIAAGFEFGKDASNNDYFLTTIYPKVTYNIIPDSLAVMLEAGLKFGGSDIGFMIQPSLWFNFKGTGALTSYDDLDTGIIVAYTYANNDYTGTGETNQLGVTFRWAF